MTKERLYSPKRIKQVMTQNGLSFNRNLGQNFLMDGNIVRRIADSAEISPEDVVIEVGPGIGTLTEELAMRAKAVYAVEIDDRFIAILRQNLSDFDNVQIIHHDALDFDFKGLIATIEPGTPVKIVANLPYYITTPLIQRFLMDELGIRSATFMVQKEVAERIIARPSTKDYGSLTLFVACFAEASIVARAPKEVFLPAPKVDSMVVHLALKPPLVGVDMPRLTRIIQSAFQQRRKTVLNSLSRSLAMDKRDVRKLLAGLGIPASARAENLSLERFIDIIRAADKG